MRIRAAQDRDPATGSGRPGLPASPANSALKPLWSGFSTKSEIIRLLPTSMNRTPASAHPGPSRAKSGGVIAAILLGIAPFFFPVVMDMLGLLTGLIQAYIFAILATVYIASATAEPEPSAPAEKPFPHHKDHP